ncbi:MAG: hypothetical protein JST80_03055 [Bdellovibrionales bacterium]|nr:hypothetical protein [Bdellovibrionales bacterium]
MWELIESECFALSTKFGAEIHAAVLLPISFQAVATFPEEPIGTFSKEFFREITKRSNRRTGTSGRIFSSRYHRSSIQTSQHYNYLINYLYSRPVSQNLARFAEEYPYSTLSGLVGNSKLGIPLRKTTADYEHVFHNHLSQEWRNLLNTEIPKSVRTNIEKGLKKEIFALLKDRLTRKRPTFGFS